MTSIKTAMSTTAKNIKASKDAKASHAIKESGKASIPASKGKKVMPKVPKVDTYSIVAGKKKEVFTFAIPSPVALGERLHEAFSNGDETLLNDIVALCNQKGMFKEKALGMTKAIKALKDEYEGCAEFAKAYTLWNKFDAVKKTKWNNAFNYAKRVVLGKTSKESNDAPINAGMLVGMLNSAVDNGIKESDTCHMADVVKALNAFIKACKAGQVDVYGPAKVTK